MTKIAVTGGSGKAGRVIVRDPAEHGHEVLNIDVVGSVESCSPEAPIPFLRADVTDFGQALEALSGGDTLPGIEAVVHLAAIPSPAHATANQIFAANADSTQFAAAPQLGLKRVVWASSETTLGLPFETPPDYAPVNAEHVRPRRELMAAVYPGVPLAGSVQGNVTLLDITKARRVLGYEPRFSRRELSS
ncbi:MAG: NAD(P)-dependent oxidoreductase [Actinomycetota bacterium]|nr:NAD(P)-dependent oxidoreductase [Actinomycetota bacterium]